MRRISSFSDPWVTDHVTFADLYSHRSGLPDAIGDPLEVFGFTREQILDRFRIVPLSPFRASYAYTDFGIVQGPARVTAPLTHWDGDTFTFVASSTLPGIRGSLTFMVGPDGRASAIVVPDPNFGTLERL